MLSRANLVPAVLCFLLILSVYQFLINQQRVNRNKEKDGWPRKIWQKWETPAQSLNEELTRLSKSWIEYNPGYRYELFTSESALTYVEDHYTHRPDIIHMFENVQDRVMRADLIRYLALLAEGGVYADIDTDCSRKIDDWVPSQFRDKARLVVGIEYDWQGIDDRDDMGTLVQLCQWTLMAKPGHPALMTVVDRAMDRLNDWSERKVDLAELNANELLATTGPEMFTEAIMDSINQRAPDGITYADITNLTTPKLFGDVLILPVSAFASGQDHSGSKAWGNEEQLMSHHFLGFETWKKDHPEVYDEEEDEDFYEDEPEHEDGQ